MSAVGGGVPEAPSKDPNLACNKDNVKGLELRLVVGPLRVRSGPEVATMRCPLGIRFG